MSAALEAFGVPAVVTRPAPDNTPISTTVIWVSPQEATPSGSDFGRRDPRRVLIIPRSAVPTLPRATTIVAAEESGGVSKTWTIEEFDRAIEPDCWRVIVSQG